MVFSMSEEFHDRWRTLRESKYDPLDCTNDVRATERVAVVFNITLLFNCGIGWHRQIIKNNNYILFFCPAVQ